MSFARFLQGAIKYRNELKPTYAKKVIDITKEPKPVGVMFSCMDHRVSTGVCTQTNPGDMFIIRNAGNMVEPAAEEAVTSAAGVLDITCLTVKVKHILVCGHSDCKAMCTLFAMKESGLAHNDSPIKQCMYRNGYPSLQAYKHLEASNFKSPFELHLDHPKKTLRAHMNMQLEDVDKLSQIHTLMQFKNINTYKFLHERLDLGLVKMAAMWFDVYSGDFFMFSEKEEKFVEVTEKTYDSLLQEHLDE